MTTTTIRRSADAGTEIAIDRGGDNNGERERLRQREPAETVTEQKVPRASRVPVQDGSASTEEKERDDNGAQTADRPRQGADSVIGSDVASAVARITADICMTVSAARGATVDREATEHEASDERKCRIAESRRKCSAVPNRNGAGGDGGAETREEDRGRPEAGTRKQEPADAC